MPQTAVVFSSILGPSCSGQVQPSMGERGGGAGGGSGELIFQDGRLISGSLEALMEHLVPTVDYYPDVSVGFARGQGAGPGTHILYGCSSTPTQEAVWGTAVSAGPLPGRWRWEAERHTGAWDRAGTRGPGAHGPLFTCSLCHLQSRRPLVTVAAVS